jgi:hypothetical protein
MPGWWLATARYFLLPITKAGLSSRQHPKQAGPQPAPPYATSQDSSSYVRYSAAWSIARVLEHAARVGDPGRQLVLAAGVGLIIQRLSMVVVDGQQPLHVRRSACQTFWPLARLFQGPASSPTSPLSPHFTNILQVRLGQGLVLGLGLGSGGDGVHHMCCAAGSARSLAEVGSLL